MSIMRDKFAMDVSHYNQQYTPQQISDYITNTSGEGFADSEKLKSLIEKSQANLQAIVKENGLTMDQMLQAETSATGKLLADLALQHCDATIELIQKGGWSRGILI